MFDVGQIIGFRADDELIEILEAHARPGESLHKTARRLLLAVGTLTITTGDDDGSD